MQGRRSFETFRSTISAAALLSCLILSTCGKIEAPHAETVEAAGAPAVWTDPKTHLTWAAKDNGYDGT